MKAVRERGSIPAGGADSQEGPETASRQYGLVADDSGRAIMLDLRGHNGTSYALPYSSLVAVGFDPSAGLTLEFTHHKVGVRGRNLRSIYDSILEHRVTFIQEEDFDMMPESATCVDSIVVVRLDEAEL
jgi:hypothetical protein